MHKCLPLSSAIYVMVNVSKTFVINNSARMHRTIQRIKTSLKEHIDTLVEAEEDADEEENDPEELMIRKEIEWKPQMDTLLLYGSWMTSKRKLYIHRIFGMPENFAEKLLLHLANSSSTQMVPQIANIYFPFGPRLPIPTFLKPLFNEKQFWVGNRILFESVELKTDDGQILCIHDGELIKYRKGRNKLRLFVMNKMDRIFWFEITMNLDPSKEFIWRLGFSRWNMHSFNDISNFIKGGDSDVRIKQNGNELEVKSDINWNDNLDMFLRRGADFTQFQHFKINQEYSLRQNSSDYVDTLIKHISNTKHPDDFLVSIDMNLQQQNVTPLLHHILNFGLIEGIPKDGKLIEFDNKKLHILSAKIANSKNKWLRSSSGELEFTLANEPTNGAYLFDFTVKLKNGLKQIVGIKIQKRKSLNEYIDALVGEYENDEFDSNEEEENNPEELIIRNEIVWQPHLDALLRYGTWLTSKRKFRMNEECNIVGMPKNFLDELLLHLSNSCSPQTMLQIVGMNFGEAVHPIPTIIKKMFNKKELPYLIMRPIVFQTVDLKAEDGRILTVFDGQLYQYEYPNGKYGLKLFVANKMDRNSWFRILIEMDPSKEFIRRLGFSQWKMESFNDIANFIKGSWSVDARIKQNGNELEAEDNIFYNPNLDMFLRRGAGFTQIRRFKMRPKQYFCDKQLEHSLDLLVNYISNTKHPEDYLDSIDINFRHRLGFCSPTSLFIKNIWKVCYEGIRKGGKFEHFDGIKLYILSAKIMKTNNKMEFTLANLPSNGEYLFDFFLRGIWKWIQRNCWN